jgi:hypothetical protein
MKREILFSFSYFAALILRFFLVCLSDNNGQLTPHSSPPCLSQFCSAILEPEVLSFPRTASQNKDFLAEPHLLYFPSLSMACQIHYFPDCASRTFGLPSIPWFRDHKGSQKLHLRPTLSTLTSGRSPRLVSSMALHTIPCGPSVCHPFYGFDITEPLKASRLPHLRPPSRKPWTLFLPVVVQCF